MLISIWSTLSGPKHPIRPIRPTCPSHESTTRENFNNLQWSFCRVAFWANCMLNVWGRGCRARRSTGAVSKVFVAAYSSKGVWRDGGRRHMGHMRHCVGFGFRLTASELRSEGRQKSRGKETLKRLLENRENYQHDSRVMTLIVGAACETRDGRKVNTKCCSCCACCGLFIMMSTRQDEFEEETGALI